MNEIEAKFPVESLEPVRERLKQTDAEHMYTVLETDTYYDTPDAMLRRRDVGVRIRRRRCIEAGCENPPEFAVLTAKGPRAGEDTAKAKTRREVEAALDDPQDVQSIFDAAGLTHQLTIQKRRARWRWNDVMLELDELPLIGCFVEIEAPSADRIEEIRAELNIEAAANTDHYVNLLLEGAAREGVENPSRIAFDSVE